MRLWMRIGLTAVFGLAASLAFIVWLGLELGDPPPGPDGEMHKDMTWVWPALVGFLMFAWLFVGCVVSIFVPRPRSAPAAAAGRRPGLFTFAIGATLLALAAASVAWDLWVGTAPAGMSLEFFAAGMVLGPPLLGLGLLRMARRGRPRSDAAA